MSQGHPGGLLVRAQSQPGAAGKGCELLPALMLAATRKLRGAMSSRRLETSPGILLK